MTLSDSAICYVCILYSERGDRCYIGIPSDSVRRLVSHNSRERGFTSRYRPWKLVFMRQYASRSPAPDAEKTLKSPKRRVIIVHPVSGTVPLQRLLSRPVGMQVRILFAESDLHSGRGFRMIIRFFYITGTLQCMSAASSFLQ